MRDEVTNRRPSRLSPFFRELAKKDTGPLRDWTRHIDGDWIWYCPKCNHIIAIIEEKDETAAEKAWGFTKRLAFKHEDHPAAALVITQRDGTCKMFTARGTPERNDTDYQEGLTRGDLAAWITSLFEAHYAEADSASHQLPAWMALV